MSNFDKNEIELKTENNKPIEFEYTKYSRFLSFDDGNNNKFDIKELELNIAGKDYNRIKQDPIRSDGIYDNKIISHKLINSCDIQNTTIKNIFVSVNHGNLFKIPAVSILEAKSIKRELSIISLCKLSSNDSTYDRYGYNNNSLNAALSKPLLCNMTIKENNLDDSTVYIIPELNILFSCNKENLEIALRSQAISTKYRSIGDNDNIIIEKDEDFDTKTTYNQLLKNFSISYNVIINDPDNYLKETYYYIYINEQIVKLWIAKNNLIKPGVYFISSDKNDKIYIHEITLKYFRDKIIYEGNSIKIGTTKYFISESKLKLKQCFDDYQNSSNQRELYIDKINKLEIQADEILKELEKAKQTINQKEDEIAILNNRLDLEYKKNISDNSVKRAENSVKRSEQLVEKEKLAYDKVVHTYEADISSMNLKSYIGMGISICGLAAAILTLIKKSK